MLKVQQLKVSNHEKFLKQGFQDYPKAINVIQRFEKLVIDASTDALENWLKSINPKILKKLGRVRTSSGTEGECLYAGRYSDVVGIDTGLYWEKNGVPGVCASVCVTDKAISDWLLKCIKKQRLVIERENDDYYEDRFTSYEKMSGKGMKGLSNSMKKAIQKWPRDI
jgi:hypothetical protein